MQLIALLLAPISFLYDLVTRLRNHLFNIGYTRSFKFDTIVISIGNLSVGGTGKSPLIEYLILLLKDKYPLATLSRGYGRKTKGFLLAGDNVTATEIGDEPFQFYKKFKSSIQVAVGEERALAIPEILSACPDTKIILLDDAFQHRTVIPNLNILLSDFNHPFYNDWVLPSGRLRERRKGAQRADILIVTKCPDNLSEEDMNSITKHARPYLKEGVPVLFSGIKYMEPKLIWSEFAYPWSENIYLFTGIAKATPLVNYLNSNYNLVKHKRFPDHHQLSSADVDALIKDYHSFNDQEMVMLTTEKDAVKLWSGAYKSRFSRIPLFYLPITSYFLKNGHIFDAEVEQVIAESGH